jgi:hypothetical protein
MSVTAKNGTACFTFAPVTAAPITESVMDEAYAIPACGYKLDWQILVSAFSCR